MPQRLPALTPLQQVVLRDRQVWIRTQDGTLFLAPEQSGCGISWGYNGSGPPAPAVVLNRLLDGINAPAPDRLGDKASTVAPGLRRLVEKAPRDEAIFTRDQLLAARRPNREQP